MCQLRFAAQHNNVEKRVSSALQLMSACSVSLCSYPEKRGRLVLCHAGIFSLNTIFPFFVFRDEVCTHCARRTTQTTHTLKFKLVSEITFYCPRRPIPRDQFISRHKKVNLFLNVQEFSEREKINELKIENLTWHRAIRVNILLFTICCKVTDMIQKSKKVMSGEVGHLDPP